MSTVCRAEPPHPWAGGSSGAGEEDIGVTELQRSPGSTQKEQWDAGSLVEKTKDISKEEKK